MASERSNDDGSLAPTVVAVALGIVFIVLVFLHVPGVNGPEYWIWRWQRRTDVAKIAIFFILAASPALIAQILFRRHRALALGLLALATAALQLAGNAIQPELHGVDRMRRIANDQLITSYYTVAETIVHLERRGFTVDWLRQFDAILQRAPQHATTKPPGPIAFYVLIIRTFGDERAPVAAAIALAILSAAAVITTWAALRTIAGNDAAFQTATLLALSPSMTVFFLYLDPIYPLLSCSLISTWFAALERDSRRDAVAFGAVLFAATMTSYTFLVLGITLGIMTILRLRRGATLRGVTTLVLIALGTFTAAHLILWLSTGFNWLSAFRTALAMQYRYLPLLHRPYPRTIPFDLLDFFLGSGWVPVVLAIFWLLKRREEEAQVKAVAISGLLTIVIVAGTGLIQAETARVWIFLLPLLLLPAALEMRRWPARHRLAVAMTLIAVTVALESNMVFIEPSSPPPPPDPARALFQPRVYRTTSFLAPLRSPPSPSPS